MLLILNCRYDINLMTDTAIEKSSLYTFTGGLTPMGIALPPEPLHLRVVTPPNTKGVFWQNVDFHLVVIPKRACCLQQRRSRGTNCGASYLSRAALLVATSGAALADEPATPTVSVPVEICSQADIILRRSSTRFVRLYAASVPSFSLWAKARSTKRGS